MKRSCTRSLLRLAGSLALVFPLWLASPGFAAAADKPCSLATLNGAYGYYRFGNTAAGPLAAVGIITFDGKGGSSSTQSISRNGVFQFDVSGTGTYKLGTDCTGRLLSAAGVEIGRIVVTDDGSTIYMLSETAGNAVYVVATKVSRK